MYTPLYTALTSILGAKCPFQGLNLFILFSQLTVRSQHPQQIQQSPQTPTAVKANTTPQNPHQRTPTSNQFSPAPQVISNPHPQSPYHLIQGQQQQQFSPVNQQRVNIPHQMQHHQPQQQQQQQHIPAQNLNYQTSPNIHNQNFQAIQQQQLQHQQMIFHQQYNQMQSHHSSPHNNQL